MLAAPLLHISPYLTLAAMLLISALAISVVAVAMSAWSLLHPPRMTDGKAVWVLKRLSPGDLGLRFSDESFLVLDESRRSGQRIKLAAWWIDAESATDQCAVLIHGYADAKVGAIAWAPLFHRLGFNILALDLRAHGDSGGACCTAGVIERHDLRQALDQLQARRPEQTKRLVLFGVSMGASIAAAVAALDDPAQSPIRALVLDSPYDDFTRVAARHMERQGAGGRLFQRTAIRLAALLAHVDFAQIRLSSLLRQTASPVLMIESSDDDVSDGPEQQALAIALTARNNPRDVRWRVDNARHLLAMQQDPQRYAQQVGEFLAAAGLNVTSTSAPTPPLVPSPGTPL